MNIFDDGIKGYLIMNCSDNYLTPEVIAGFAKNSVFKEKTPTMGWSGNLYERNKLISQLKKDFSLKKVKPILEKLVKENKLEKKDHQLVFKGKKGTYKTVYRLPADKGTKPQ